MNKHCKSFLALVFVFTMLFLTTLMPIAEARGRVCDFCDGMYLKERDGGTKTIRDEKSIKMVFTILDF